MIQLLPIGRPTRDLFSVCRLDFIAMKYRPTRKRTSDNLTKLHTWVSLKVQDFSWGCFIYRVCLILPASVSFVAHSPCIGIFTFGDASR